MLFAHTVPRSGVSQGGFEQMLEDIKKFRHHEFFFVVVSWLCRACRRR